MVWGHGPRGGRRDAPPRGKCIMACGTQAAAAHPMGPTRLMGRAGPCLSAQLLVQQLLRREWRSGGDWCTASLPEQEAYGPLRLSKPAEAATQTSGAA
jgi:hypothetical protein